MMNHRPCGMEPSYVGAVIALAFVVTLLATVGAIALFCVNN